MLDVEPSKRPTALEVLQHPWMTSSNKQAANAASAAAVPPPQSLAAARKNLRAKQSSNIKVRYIIGNEQLYSCSLFAVL